MISLNRINWLILNAFIWLIDWLIEILVGFCLLFLFFFLRFCSRLIPSFGCAFFGFTFYTHKFLVYEYLLRYKVYTFTPLLLLITCVSYNWFAKVLHNGSKFFLFFLSVFSFFVLQFFFLSFFLVCFFLLFYRFILHTS